MSRQSSVVVCGGSRIIREGAAALVRAAKFRVLGLHANLDDIEIKGGIKSSDLILMIGEQAVVEGFLENAAKLKETHPGCHVVALVSSCSDEERWAAAHLGLDGVLLKSISSEVLCRSLELVLMGEQVFIINPRTSESSAAVRPDKESESPRALSPEAPEDRTVVPVDKMPQLQVLNPTTVVSSRREGLSDRELEVLDCLVSGHSNKVIARRCNITEATVKVHLKAILRKISVANRTQAAVWAINKMHMNTSLDYGSQGAQPPIGANSHAGAANHLSDNGVPEEDAEDSRPACNGKGVHVNEHLLMSRGALKAASYPGSF